MSIYWWIAYVDFFVLCYCECRRFRNEFTCFFLYFLVQVMFSAEIAGLWDGRSDIRIPRRARVSPFSQNRPAHWGSYSVCAEILCRGLNPPGREVEAEIKDEFTVPALPPYAFVVWTRSAVILSNFDCRLYCFRLIHLVTSCSDLQACIFNTLRTRSFKLFKRPFPGFLKILTL